MFNTQSTNASRRRKKFNYFLNVSTESAKLRQLLRSTVTLQRQKKTGKQSPNFGKSQENNFPNSTAKIFIFLLLCIGNGIEQQKCGKLKRNSKRKKKQQLKYYDNVFFFCILLLSHTLCPPYILATIRTLLLSHFYYKCYSE